MQSKSKEAHVWYLFHSGFAVQTPEHFLVFDYYMDRPAARHTGLDGGVVDPSALRGRKVLVFSSHAHSDHFNPVILRWKDHIDTIHYVLSHDIGPQKDMEQVLLVHPGCAYDLEGVPITVLDSTDIGVAFLVQVDGFTIFHAGDLNWWHWEGEPDDENRAMAENYKKQIDLLRGKPIDIAFIPVDPRLEEHYLLGLDYFMKTTDTQMAFPMHFGKDHTLFRKLEKDSRAAAYAAKTVEITHRGQHFVYEKTELPTA